MSLFLLDTAGDHDLFKNDKPKAEDSYIPFSGRGPLLFNSVKNKIPDSIIDDDDDYGGLPPPSKNISHILSQYDTRETVKPKPKTKAQREVEIGLEMLKAAEEERKKNKLIQKRPGERTPKTKLTFPEIDFETGKCSDKLSETNVEKEMADSILPGIGLKKAIPELPDRKLRDLRRIERSKTKGEGWFHMPATEVTEEVENDLKILQMRSVLNPKHFYKKNDLKVLPKYFQIGTVQHSPLDYYNERDVRKNKKKTMVDELLADAEFQKYTKRKYQEVSARNNRYAHKKAMSKMKKLKKNK